jgi:hypothetical protein
MKPGASVDASANLSLPPAFSSPKSSTHHTHLAPLQVVFIPLPVIRYAHLFPMYFGYEPCLTALSLPTDARTLHVHKMVVSSLPVRNKTFINGRVNRSKNECITDVKNKD